MQEVDLPSQLGMPYARDVQVDACFVQLARAAAIASAFGGLMYKMLILRPQSVATIDVFVVSLINHLVVDASRVHQKDIQVLCRFARDV